MRGLSLVGEHYLTRSVPFSSLLCLRCRETLGVTMSVTHTKDLGQAPYSLCHPTPRFPESPNCHPEQSEGSHPAPCHTSPNRLYFTHCTKAVCNCEAKEERVVDTDAPKDYFISYTQADQRWAEWIAWHLEEAGYTTLLQAWDFQAGSNFVLAMDAATRQATRTIAVLSPDYFASQFTPSEWAAAFRRDPTGEQGLLLPVRVR